MGRLSWLVEWVYPPRQVVIESFLSPLTMLILSSPYFPRRGNYLAPILELFSGRDSTFPFNDIQHVRTPTISVMPTYTIPSTSRNPGTGRSSSTAHHANIDCLEQKSPDLSIRTLRLYGQTDQLRYLTYNMIYLLQPILSLEQICHTVNNALIKMKRES